MNKQFYLAIALTVISVSSLFIVSSLPSRPRTRPAPVASTAMPTPVGTWSIFRSSEYGFEIQSPPWAYFRPSAVNQSSFSLNNFTSNFQVHVYPDTKISEIVPQPDFQGMCGDQYVDKVIENKIITINTQKMRQLVQKEGVLYLTSFCLTGPDNNLIVLKLIYDKADIPPMVSQMLNTFTLISPSRVDL